MPPDDAVQDPSPAAAITPAPPVTSPPPHPDQLRLQMMSTEHWSLLASRNLAWTEVFARASMFLSALSFSVVALALAGQASGFGEEFRIFALIVLPVVLFLGITTTLRMDSANHHDALCVIGMNRIRAGYLEIAPDLERFFVMGTTDDIAGIGKTMGGLPNRPFFVDVFAATPTLVSALNCVIAATIVALGAIQIGLSSGVAILAGAVVAVVVFITWSYVVREHAMQLMNSHHPAFPTKDPAG
jgi:hypothetical protein